MNLTAIPSLQKMILLKLAAVACNKRRIKALIKKPVALLDERSIPFINEAVSSFKLPNILHQNLFCLMKPVIIEISSWILYIHHIHKEVAHLTRTGCSCLDETDLQESLQWQTVGLIDKHLTSLGLIRNERLDTAFRFVLACNCCSEADILELWCNLTVTVQKNIFTFNFLPIVSYWTHRLSTAEKHDYKFIPNPTFPYEFQFEFSLKYVDAMYDFYEKLPFEVRNYLFGTYGRDIKILKRKLSNYVASAEFKKRVTVGLVNVDNIAALKYFLQKFERIKGEILLEVVARNHFISNELLVFCLSKMRQVQVTELLKSRHGGRVLSCLVNSPWQESLQSFIDNNWNDIAKTDAIELLKHMISFKIKKQRWRDFDYTSVAKDLCHRCSQSFEQNFE